MQNDPEAASRNGKERLIFSRYVSPFAILSFAAASGVSAQTMEPRADSYRNEIFVGSQPENYLRYLQSSGIVPLYPWSSRGFSPSELDRLVPKDSAHPWQGRFSPAARGFGPLRFDLVRPTATFRYNTGFAYGSNDGAVWAGRGLTSAVQLGFLARLGPLSLTAAPIAFRAENTYFYIQQTARTGPQFFANALFGGVDQPQRFGDSPYSQVDPGQSSVRLDLPGLALGASTANMGWGPGFEYPLLLGSNAAGFPHLFAGTSAPVNLFIARLHTKVFWGTLNQSKFATVTGPSTYTSRLEPGRKRFATGIILIAEPRGITGLEVGGARFFHSIWPRSGIPRSYFTKVFQVFLKENLDAPAITDPRFPPDELGRGLADNQLVEVFARWVLPRSGFEVAFEYGRDDHSEDKRDFLQEPDHTRFYNIAMRKVFAIDARSLTAGRFELINLQRSSLDRVRGQGEVYVHGLIRQGHTQRGQLLGADVGVGAGAGSTVAVDRYTPNGRLTISWVRNLRQEKGEYDSVSVQEPRSMDVTHALGAEMMRTVGGFDVTTGLTFVRSFNRVFVADAANVNATLGVRYNLR